MTLKEIYDNGPLMCRILVDEKTGQHFIEVMCGDIGMYEVTVPLMDQEVEDFRRDPDSVRHLVREITFDPAKAVKERGLKNGRS